MESWSTVDRVNPFLICGAEAESRTRMGLPPTVFETAASTIPPLRHAANSICAAPTIGNRFQDASLNLIA